MNLMEITKGYKPKQNEQMDQTMYSLDTTDKWNISYFPLSWDNDND